MIVCLFGWSLLLILVIIFESFADNLSAERDQATFTRLGISLCHFCPVAVVIGLREAGEDIDLFDDVAHAFVGAEGAPVQVLLVVIERGIVVLVVDDAQVEFGNV